MTRKSTEINNEVRKTKNRLSELREMRLQINGKLETLQQGFIDGKASIDSLQSEQGKLTILDSSIKALEAKQSETQANFVEAERQEKRQSLLEQAKSIAVEAETAFNNYVAMRNELDSFIAGNIGKTLDELVLFRTKQREYRIAFGEIKRQMPEASQQIGEELDRLGLSDNAASLAGSDNESLPRVEFGGIIEMLERIVGAKRQEEIDIALQASA